VKESLLKEKRKCFKRYFIFVRNFLSTNITGMFMAEGESVSLVWKHFSSRKHVAIRSISPYLSVSDEHVLKKNNPEAEGAFIGGRDR